MARHPLRGTAGVTDVLRALLVCALLLGGVAFIGLVAWVIAGLIAPDERK